MILKCIIMHILPTTLFLPKQHADEYWAPWKQSSVWCTSHMSKSHRQKKLSSVLAIYLFFPLAWCSETSCLAEIIMWRQHTRFASPACSKHQMLFLTFWAELPRHSEQVSVPPGPRGRFRGRSYIIISHFKLFTLPPKPSHHQLQACPARSLFLILILFHFQMAQHVHWGFSGEMPLSMHNFNSLATCNYVFSYSKI